MFLLKLAIRPWKESPFTQAFMSVALGFLLFLVCFLNWLDTALDPVLKQFTNDQVITVYLDASVAKDEEPKIMDAIRGTVGAAANRLGALEFTPAEGFLKELEKNYPSLTDELKGLGSEMNTVVPRYISINGAVSMSAREKLTQLPGVDAVDSSNDRFSQIAGAFVSMQWVARVFAIALGLSIFMGMILLGRMNNHTLRDSLQLLRQWGAGQWMVFVPGILSGACVALFGGSLAILGWKFLSVPIATQISHVSPFLNQMPLPNADSFVGFPIAVIGITVFLGMLSVLFGRNGSFRKSIFGRSGA